MCGGGGGVCVCEGEREGLYPQKGKETSVQFFPVLLSGEIMNGPVRRTLDLFQMQYWGNF